MNPNCDSNSNSSNTRDSWKPVVQNIFTMNSNEYNLIQSNMAGIGISTPLPGFANERCLWAVPNVGSRREFHPPIITESDNWKVVVGRMVVDSKTHPYDIKPKNFTLEEVCKHMSVKSVDLNLFQNVHSQLLMVIDRVVQIGIFKDWLLLKSEQCNIPISELYRHVDICIVNGFDRLLAEMKISSVLPIPLFYQTMAGVHYYYLSFVHPANSKIEKLNSRVFHDPINEVLVTCEQGIQLPLKYHTRMANFQIYMDEALSSYLMDNNLRALQSIHFQHILFGFLQMWIRGIAKISNVHPNEVASSLALRRCSKYGINILTNTPRENTFLYTLGQTGDSFFYLLFSTKSQGEVFFKQFGYSITNTESEFVSSSTIIQYYRQFIFAHSPANLALFNTSLNHFSDKTVMAKSGPDFLSYLNELVLGIQPIHESPPENCSDSVNNAQKDGNDVESVHKQQSDETVQKDTSEPFQTNSSSVNKEGILIVEASDNSKDMPASLDTPPPSYTASLFNTSLERPFLKARTVAEINAMVDVNVKVSDAECNETTNSVQSEPNKASEILVDGMLNINTDDLELEGMLLPFVRASLDKCYSYSIEPTVKVDDFASLFSVSEYFNKAVIEAPKDASFAQFLHHVYSMLTLHYTILTSQATMEKYIYDVLESKYSSHERSPQRIQTQNNTIQGEDEMHKDPVEESGVSLITENVSNQGALIKKEVIDYSRACLKKAEEKQENREVTTVQVSVDTDTRGSLLNKVIKTEKNAGDYSDKKQHRRLPQRISKMIALSRIAANYDKIEQNCVVLLDRRDIQRYFDKVKRKPVYIDSMVNTTSEMPIVDVSLQPPDHSYAGRSVKEELEPAEPPKSAKTDDLHETPEPTTQRSLQDLPTLTMGPVASTYQKVKNPITKPVLTSSTKPDGIKKVDGLLLPWQSIQTQNTPILVTRAHKKQNLSVTEKNKNSLISENTQKTSEFDAGTSAGYGVTASNTEQNHPLIQPDDQKSLSIGQGQNQSYSSSFRLDTNQTRPIIAPRVELNQNPSIIRMYTNQKRPSIAPRVELNQNPSIIRFQPHQNPQIMANRVDSNQNPSIIRFQPHQNPQIMASRVDSNQNPSIVRLQPHQNPSFFATRIDSNQNCSIVRLEPHQNPSFFATRIDSNQNPSFVATRMESNKNPSIITLGSHQNPQIVSITSENQNPSTITRVIDQNEQLFMFSGVPCQSTPTYTIANPSEPQVVLSRQETNKRSLYLANSSDKRNPVILTNVGLSQNLPTMMTTSGGTMHRLVTSSHTIPHPPQEPLSSNLPVGIKKLTYSPNNGARVTGNAKRKNPILLTKAKKLKPVTEVSTEKAGSNSGSSTCSAEEFSSTPPKTTSGSSAALADKIKDCFEIIDGKIHLKEGYVLKDGIVVPLRKNEEMSKVIKEKQTVELTCDWGDEIVTSSQDGPITMKENAVPSKIQVDEVTSREGSSPQTSQHEATAASNCVSYTDDDDDVVTLEDDLEIVETPSVPQNNSKSNPLRCGFCSLLFKSVDSLKQHEILSHVYNTTYQCSLCCKCFTQPHYLELHVKVKHHKNHYCYFCQITLPDVKSLETHLQSGKHVQNKRLYNQHSL